MKTAVLLYVMLNVLMVAVEIYRYHTRFDYMAVKYFFLNELTFVSLLLFVLDTFAIFFGCVFGFIYLITGHTIVLPELQ